MKYKIASIGHFSNSLDGQTIKTKIVTEELTNKYGSDSVRSFNISGGFFSKMSLIIKAPFVLKNATNIILFPAQKALQLLCPLLTFWNKMFHKTIHYCVIGGWLPSFIERKKWLLKYLKKINFIYVETSTMKFLLEKMGLSNIIIMPNCKNLKILNKEELMTTHNAPYKLCVFSRVTKKKGIEFAIDAVTSANNCFKTNIYSLDIYGQIDSDDVKWFNTLSSSFPDFVCYKGIVSYDQTTDVLQKYFALLFPTLFFTEGIPGTVIDAYAAGLPVIASKWQSFDDVIQNGITGLSFDFNDKQQLIDLLIKIANDPSIIDSLRENCLLSAMHYKPDVAIKSLILE